jgi:hypothetical protein
MSPLRGPNEFAALLPSRVVGSLFLDVEVEQILAGDLHLLEELLAPIRRDEIVERTHLLVSLLVAQPQGVCVHYAPPEQLDDCNDSCRVRHDDAILVVELSGASREDLRSQDGLVSLRRDLILP